MKILITGGTGMVGSAFSRIDHDHEFVLVGTKQYDLVDYKTTLHMIEEHKPDAIIHLAAKVGGVKGNSDYVADFYSDNIRINTNILDASRRLQVKKVLSLLSTCIYPEPANYPLTEDQIHSGPPHISNFGYAYSKRMLDIHSRALRQQYGCNFVCAVPNNIYGPNDNFDLNSSHVIPALMRKIWEAKINNKPCVEVWGDGSPLREFTYSDDVAKILLVVLKEYDSVEPVNIGNNNERTIASVTQTLADCLEYKGEIRYDKSKPSGQYRKPSLNQRLLKTTSWKESNFTSFEDGIKKTCDWFKLNYPNIRGVK